MIIGKWCLNIPRKTERPSRYYSESGLILREYKPTRVRDKNFMFFNQAKDIEYWAAFQGRLIYLYSLVLIPEDKLPV